MTYLAACDRAPSLLEIVPSLLPVRAPRVDPLRPFGYLPGSVKAVGGDSEEEGARFSLPMERTLLVLLLIGFFTWLGFAASGYAARHAELTEEWVRGSTRLVEVSLVAEDRERLACASDREFDTLHCRYRASQARREPVDEGTTLQPLNTIKGELFLGAGLWLNPSLRIPTTGQRFTVMCHYHIAGVVKSASLRWAENGAFIPLAQTVTVGRLTDCAVPE